MKLSLLALALASKRSLSSAKEVDSNRNLQEAVEGFDYVGEGYCKDSSDNYYSYGSENGVSNGDCGEKCKNYAENNAGFLVGFTYGYGMCECYFDIDPTPDGDTVLEPGTGPVDHTDGGTGSSCYKVAAGLTLADYEGTSVVGEVEGEPSSCTAVASAGTDEITCNFEWRDADGTVKTSVSGAKLFSDIIAGTCEDATIAGGGAFKSTVASSNESTNGKTSATLTGTVTAGEKTGTVTKIYCARADLKDDAEKVSVLAAMTQVEVTYIYDQTGNFSVDNIVTSPFNAESATAEDTREASLTAFLSNDQGVKLTETLSYEVGTVLNIGIESDDTDVKIDITSLEIKKTADSSYDPAITPIDANGPNFVTTKTCGDAGGNLCVVGTLLVPRIYDENSSGSIVVTGTAALTYVTGRRLHSKDTRALQADAEEAFELEVELKGQDGLPQIATAENSGSFVGASSAAFAAIAAGYAIIA